MIGYHARLRDATGHSYPFNACTRSNQERYSSVQVIFCGSWKHSCHVKGILTKKLDWYKESSIWYNII